MWDQSAVPLLIQWFVCVMCLNKRTSEQSSPTHANKYAFEHQHSPMALHLLFAWKAKEPILRPPVIMTSQGATGTCWGKSLMWNRPQQSRLWLAAYFLQANPLTPSHRLVTMPLDRGTSGDGSLDAIMKDVIWCFVGGEFPINLLGPQCQLQWYLINVQTVCGF